MKELWVFPGGGAHGAWQAASIAHYCKTRNLSPKENLPSAIIATSAGALNAVALSSHTGKDDVFFCCSKMTGAWTEALASPLFMKWRCKAHLLLTWGSYALGLDRFKFIQRMIEKNPLEKMRSSIVGSERLSIPIEFFLTSLTKREPRIVKETAIASEAFRLAIASSSVPGLFPPHPYKEEYLADGGLFSGMFWDYVASRSQLFDKTVVFLPDAVDQSHHGLSSTKVSNVVAVATNIMASDALETLFSEETGHIEIATRLISHNYSAISLREKNIEGMLRDIEENPDLWDLRNIDDYRDQW